MFTGITTTAVVTGIDLRPRSARLTVQHRFAGVTDGESIAVHGCCLTVASQQQSPGFGQLFTADVSAETLRRTSLADLTPGSTVNVERSATVRTLLGGHLVQGHVDGVVEILDLQPGDGWTELVVVAPPGLLPYVAEKGSVTLDGVSLTVARLRPDAFIVSLIPVTLRETTLGTVSPGARLNLEVDHLSRYVHRHLQAYRDRELDALRIGDGARNGDRLESLTGPVVDAVAGEAR